MAQKRHIRRFCAVLFRDLRVTFLFRVTCWNHREWKYASLLRRSNLPPQSVEKIVDRGQKRSDSDAFSSLAKP
jgi:hypothetical protein